MPILAKSPSERRASLQEQVRALQADLDHLVTEAEAAGLKNDTAAWARLRAQQRVVARKLASVTASIAQLDHAARVNKPKRRWSERGLL